MKFPKTSKEILLRVKSEVEKEISLLEKLKEELDQIIPELKNKPASSYNLRATGSILHDFYCGMENIFRRIGQELNGGLPIGEDWHNQLLKDMSIEIRGIRPAVISEDSRIKLQRYLGFRHLFRNIYGFSLEENRIKELAEDCSNVFDRLKKEIAVFLKLM